MNLLAALWVVGLNLLAEGRLETPLYGWCALGAAAMVAWGIYESRAERIKPRHGGLRPHHRLLFLLQRDGQTRRSASLMALGILFVGGGWYWEKLRRRLVAGLVSGGVQ